MFNVQCAFECMWWTVTDPQYPIYDVGYCTFECCFPLFASFHNNNKMYGILGMHVVATVPNKITILKNLPAIFLHFLRSSFTRSVRTKQNRTFYCRKNPSALIIIFLMQSLYILLMVVCLLFCFIPLIEYCVQVICD